VNKDSVLTLAQKEFSGKIYEPSFIILMIIFTGTVFIYLQSVQEEMILGMLSRWLQFFPF